VQQPVATTSAVPPYPITPPAPPQPVATSSAVQPYPITQPAPPQQPVATTSAVQPYPITQPAPPQTYAAVPQPQGMVPAAEEEENIQIDGQEKPIAEKLADLESERATIGEDAYNAKKQEILDAL